MWKIDSTFDDHTFRVFPQFITPTNRINTYRTTLGRGISFYYFKKNVSETLTTLSPVTTTSSIPRNFVTVVFYLPGLFHPCPSIVPPRFNTKTLRSHPHYVVSFTFSWRELLVVFGNFYTESINSQKAKPFIGRSEYFDGTPSVGSRVLNWGQRLTSRALLPPLVDTTPKVSVTGEIPQSLDNVLERRLHNSWG